MRSWIALGGLVVLASGCLHEQVPNSQARIEQQRAAQAAQAAQASARAGEQQRQAQQLQQRVSQQQRLIQAQRSQLEQYRAMQVAGSAPAGSQFGVKFDQAIDESLHPGEIIAGHSIGPLLGADDTVVAAPGALVTARVVRVDRAPTPRIELAFRDIETVNGETVPLHATVRSEQASQAFDARPSQGAEMRDYDAVIYPKGRAPSPTAVGGGPPPSTGEQRQQPRQPQQQQQPRQPQQQQPETGALPPSGAAQQPAGPSAPSGQPSKPPTARPSRPSRPSGAAKPGRAQRPATVKVPAGTRIDLVLREPVSRNAQPGAAPGVPAGTQPGMR